MELLPSRNIGLTDSSSGMLRVLRIDPSAGSGFMQFGQRSFSIKFSSFTISSSKKAQNSKILTRYFFFSSDFIVDEGKADIHTTQKLFWLLNASNLSILSFFLDRASEKLHTVETNHRN